MNLKEANAGALVRAVLDAVHLVADEHDLDDQGFSDAMNLVDDTSARNPVPEREAMLHLIQVLRRLRRETKHA